MPSNTPCMYCRGTKHSSRSTFVIAFLGLTYAVLTPPALALTEIHNVTELQAMQNDLEEEYVLANDIDASETAAWNDGAGFVPIGMEDVPFYGSFDGQGHAISGLTIHRLTEKYTGLFGLVGGEVQIQNVGLVNVEISGRNRVGGLAGVNFGTVQQCYVTGSVSGFSVVGGGIGFNEGSIIQCYAMGDVSGVMIIGGLVGGGSCSNSGTITNCYATSTVTGGQIVGGLIGVDFSGTIIQSYATGRVSGDQGIGGLIGGTRGIVEQCYATGAVSGDDVTGGLIGVTLYSTVSRCYAVGVVSGISSIGGLIGSNNGSANMCYATGAVLGISKVGGLVGNSFLGRLSQCYAAGPVSGDYFAGGLIGNAYKSGTSVDSFWDTETTGQTASDGGTGITTAQLLQSSTFIAAGWDYTEVWTQADGQTIPYFSAGTPSGTNYALDVTIEGNGTVSTTNGIYPAWSILGLMVTPEPDHAFAGWLGDGFFLDTPIRLDTLPVVMYGDMVLDALFLPNAPISIYTIEDLQKIGQEPAFPISWEYHIENDIDASTTKMWNDDAGFTPIGWHGFPFTGILDGQNHVISSLRVSHSSLASNHIGLLGSVGTTGQIEDLGIIGGMISGYSYLGLLAGENYGTVTRCYAVGEVAGIKHSSELPDAEVNPDDLCPLEEEENVSLIGGTMDVHHNTFAGGLIGRNQGPVTQCYASGTVSGDNYLGGLTGENYKGTLTQCYAKVAVSGNRCIGGFLGYDFDGMSTQCYSTGRVEGVEKDIGGMVGYSWNYCMDYSYWDMQTSGQTESDGGDGKTTAEMKQQATFIGWDFDTVWDIVENTTYPFLRDVPDMGEGEEEGAPAEGEVEGVSTEGTTEGISEGEGMSIEGTEEGEGIIEGEGVIEGEGQAEQHTADQNADGMIDLSELLRVIQFFNSGGFHCETGTEDGFAPGSGGGTTCSSHASDYNPHDWTIGLSELLRLIQFFNSGGYHVCEGSEDGYCPGAL